MDDESFHSARQYKPTKQRNRDRPSQLMREQSRERADRMISRVEPERRIHQSRERHDCENRLHPIRKQRQRDDEAGEERDSGADKERDAFRAEGPEQRDVGAVC